MYMQNKKYIRRIGQCLIALVTCVPEEHRAGIGVLGSGETGLHASVSNI